VAAAHGFDLKGYCGRRAHGFEVEFKSVSPLTPPTPSHKQTAPSAQKHKFERDPQGSFFLPFGKGRKLSFKVKVKVKVVRCRHTAKTLRCHANWPRRRKRAPSGLPRFLLLEDRGCAGLEWTCFSSHCVRREVPPLRRFPNFRLRAFGLEPFIRRHF